MTPRSVCFHPVPALLVYHAGGVGRSLPDLAFIADFIGPSSFRSVVRSWWLTASLSLLMLAPFGVIAQISNSPRQKNVLVIYDEQDKLPGLAILDQSIRSTLSSDPSFSIDVYSENMDRSRFQDQHYYEVLDNYFREKYAGKKIDVIISAMGPSLDFLLEHSANFSPGTPIVF